MKTTINIPDELMLEVLKISKANTKKDAIITAMEDFVKRKEMAALSEILGTFKNFMSQDELNILREK